MAARYLSIKELTIEVGGGITPRMVRHYHQLGLLPPVRRSEANYRLYTQQDVQRLRRIVALNTQKRFRNLCSSCCQIYLTALKSK